MLILKNNGVDLSFLEEGARFQLPNGDYVSPAYAGWKSGPYELVQAPEEPQLTIEQRRSMMQMSFAQLLIGLVAEGWITKAEGAAWLAGTPPTPITDLIDQLPEDAQFAALARAVRPSIILRLDPLVVGLGSFTGKTEQQIDTFFQTYSVV